MAFSAGHVFTTRYQMRKALGKALILRINPQSVLRFAGSNQPMTLQMRLMLLSWRNAFPIASPVLGFVQKCLYSVEPFYLGDNAFSEGVPMEDEERYRLFLNFISNQDNIAETDWYKKLTHMLATDGVAHHKSIKLTSEQDIRAFLQSYVAGMVESLKTTGYDPSKASDLGTAFIDADGFIQKSDAGNHRFSAARILGVTPVPVEIVGIHRDWVRSHVGQGGTEALRHALARVERAHQEPRPAG